MRITVRTYALELDGKELEVLEETISEVLQKNEDGHMNLSPLQHGLLSEMQDEIHSYSR